jgi:hypothetical protein
MSKKYLAINVNDYKGGELGFVNLYDSIEEWVEKNFPIDLTKNLYKADFEELEDLGDFIDEEASRIEDYLTNPYAGASGSATSLFTIDTTKNKINSVGSSKVLKIFKKEIDQYRKEQFQLYKNKK